MNNDLAALARLVAQGAERCKHWECQQKPRFATVRVVIVWNDTAIPPSTSEWLCDRHNGHLRQGEPGSCGYHYRIEPTAWAIDARVANELAWGGT